MRNRFRHWKNKKISNRERRADRKKYRSKRPTHEDMDAYYKEAMNIPKDIDVFKVGW